MVPKVGQSSMRLSIKDFAQVQNLQTLVRRHLRVFNYRFAACKVKDAVDFGLYGQSQ